MTGKREVIERIAVNVAEMKRRIVDDKLSFYEPYVKQQEFHDMGAFKQERLLRAGNQLGKTEAGAYEMAIHLTGRYPDWWMGRRWDRPIKAWAAGVTGLSTRDVIQKKLFGEIGQLGTGAIPRDCLSREKITLARGISDLYDTIRVKHVSGGDSMIRLKTYEQGREKFQGDAIDLGWFDEEPPLDVYLETLARLTTTDGMCFITFTPLKGETDVVLRFMGTEVPEQCGEVQMRMRDAKHMTPERVKAALARYPTWQHEARLNGEPMAGSGRVFAFPEDDIMCDPFEIPHHWSLLWGIDFGLNHPFGGSLIAWDKDNDVIYVIRCVRIKNAMPIQHAAALKSSGKDIPVAWPQDGNQRREFEGALLPTAKIYKAHGLKMMDSHAKFPDGSNSTEAGIMEMQERFGSARLKVFRNIPEFFDEYRSYHRDEDGVLVKLRDDIMSATRVAIMAKRGAKIREKYLPEVQGMSGATKLAIGVDPNAWGA